MCRRECDKRVFSVRCGVQWMCDHSVNEKLWTQFILNNYKSQIILTMYHIQRVLFWSKFLCLVESFGHLCFSVWFRPNLLFSFTSFTTFTTSQIFSKKNCWIHNRKFLKRGFTANIYEGCYISNYIYIYIYIHTLINIYICINVCMYVCMRRTFFKLVRDTCNNSVSHPS